jgi:small GTP-binding protein
MTSQTLVPNNKIVAIGDGAVGKTCLLIVYVNNEFPTDYVPTVFENYSTRIKYQNKIVQISLWDTAGQEEYDQLRFLSYPGADIFLLCFSLVSLISFDNIKSRWMKEIKEKCEKPHNFGIILVGTKSDMRDDAIYVQKIIEKGENIVTREMGLKLAEEIGAFSYYETSSLHRKNITELFDSCMEYKFKRKHKGKSCKQQ